jgi:uncharacterized protein YcbK (DUF882 family)
MDKLSTNFSLAEMTHSATATRRGLSNKPTDYAMGALRITAERMEVVRALLGDKVISVLSGYRSPEVNKAVKGAKNSAHMSGLAVDFICPGFGTPREIVEHLAKNLTGFDQVIEEFGEWVHIGFGPGSRGQVLTARKVDGKTVYDVFGG